MYLKWWFVFAGFYVWILVNHNIHKYRIFHKWEFFHVLLCLLIVWIFSPNIHKQSVFYQCESLLCLFTCPNWLYFFVTKSTNKGFFTSMNPFVSLHFSWMFKLFFTTFTIKEFFTNLNSFMFLYFHWLYEIYCYNMHKQSVFYQCKLITWPF